MNFKKMFFYFFKKKKVKFLAKNLIDFKSNKNKKRITKKINFNNQIKKKKKKIFK